MTPTPDGTAPTFPPADWLADELRIALSQYFESEAGLFAAAAGECFWQGVIRLREACGGR